MKTHWLRLLTFLLALCAGSAAEAQTTGTIKGKVFDGTTPVAGISVGVFDLNQVPKYMVTTTNQGDYTFNNLPLGKYKVYFSTSGTDYIAQWYNNAATFAAAQEIDLTADKPNSDLGTTLLVTGGIISGTISDAFSGIGISAVTVQAFNANDSSIWFTGKTDASGLYSIKGLASGSYKIRFRAFGTNYITAWYASADATHAVVDETAAESVPVAIGGTVEISAKLTAGGSVSGKVTIKETGVGLAGARVNVYSSSDSSTLKGMATTGDQGQYTVSGLLSGVTYKVQFFEATVNNAGAGISKWYNEQADFSTATSVDLGAANIDGMFSGAVISGIVTNEDNAPLSGVIVTAYDNSGNAVAVSQPTGSDGIYKIEGLKRGGYKLYFKPLDNSGYASRWHNNKMAINSADVVTVASLADRPTIDAFLRASAEKLIPIYNVLLLKKRCSDANGTPMHCNCFEADGTPAYCPEK